MEFETSVDEIVRRTQDVKSFRFNRPKEFEYDPGQYLYITILIDGEEQAKHFTISSSPTEKEFIEFTKKITDHEFSLALDKFKAGDWAYIDGPYGDFVFKGEYPKIGMITGGIGITPCRSIMKYCTDMGIKSQITLLYGNRTEGDIVFKEELELLEKKNPNIRIVHTLSRAGDEWKGRRGHVDLELVKEEIPDYMDQVFYVCGPPSLVADIVKALENLKIPGNKIKTEDFLGY